MLDFRKLWDQGLTFEPFVASCKAEHCGLWQGIYRSSHPAMDSPPVTAGNDECLPY